MLTKIKICLFILFNSKHERFYQFLCNRTDNFLRPQENFFNYYDSDERYLLKLKDYHKRITGK